MSGGGGGRVDFVSRGRYFGIGLSAEVEIAPEATLPSFPVYTNNAATHNLFDKKEINHYSSTVGS